MNRTEYFETSEWVKGEKKQWSPKVQLILAFVLGLLALSPAILGIYWQHLLPIFNGSIGAISSQRSWLHKPPPGSPGWLTFFSRRRQKSYSCSSHIYQLRNPDIIAVSTQEPVPKVLSKSAAATFRPSL